MNHFLRGLVALLGVFCSACSSLAVTHQLVPRAEGARYEEHGAIGLDVWTPISIPADYLRLERQDISLTCACQNFGSTDLFMGPLWFPVIPVFPITLFLDELPGDPLLLMLQLSPVRGTIEFVPGHVEVRDSDGHLLTLRQVDAGSGDPEMAYPQRSASRSIPPLQPMTLSGPQAFWYVFDQDAAEEEEAFTITVRGATRDGITIELPQVTLERAKGLAFFMAP